MKYFLLVFCFSLSFNVYSQTVEGLVLSKETNQGIPYVKIAIENKSIGTISDDQGRYVLNLNNTTPNEFLIIDVAGYQIYRKEIKDFLIQTTPIYLVPEKVIDIEEVVLKSRNYKLENVGYTSKSKTLHIDYLPKSSKTAQRNYTEEELSQPQNELAVPIKISKKSKVMKINIHFAKFTSTASIPIRFTFYTNFNNKPNQTINTEDYVFEIDKNKIVNGVFSVDVSSMNFILDKGKYYLSFQPLKNDFDGAFFISAGIFGGSYFRKFLEGWKTLPASFAPAINIDVQTTK